HIGLLDRNSVRFLLGIDTKFKPVAPLPAVNEIVEMWCERWLRPLCERDDWGDRVEKIRNIDLNTIFPTGK
ncbi:MAG: hypothetical protein QGG96_00610, partial [Candidatus Poseidoniaceae archaeon]|nr:hypothetical protein [Candidatus Poseidoniaceae archaeon]